MTAALKKAFEKAASLPSAAQEQLAAQLHDDIEGELKWDHSLERSQPLLEKLASKALRQKRSGRTVKRGFGDL
jgi:hypothetical protein